MPTGADGGGERKIGVLDRRLTLFDELYENRVVPTDGQPKAVLIFLNDHTSLNQPWEGGRERKFYKKGATKLILLDRQCLF